MSTKSLYDVQHVTYWSNSGYEKETTVSYHVSKGVKYDVTVGGEDLADLHKAVIDLCEAVRRRAERSMMPPTIATIAVLEAPRSADNAGATEVDFEAPPVVF